MQRQRSRRSFPRLYRGSLLPTLAILSLAPLVLVGCAEEISGPEPALENPTLDAELPPVAPEIICQMQHPEGGTSVVISGEDFSPLPFDIPNDPRVALPSLHLQLTQTLLGESTDIFSLYYGSEPEEANAQLLSWQSNEQMTFQVTEELVYEDGTTGMLPVGIHDLYVTNANANEAVSVGALAVTDRPRVQGIDPGITCLAQGPRTFEVSGSTLLRIREDEAFVRIADLDGSVIGEFGVDSLDACQTIAHEGIDAAICDGVTFTLEQDAIPVGFPDVMIQNPETSACASVAREDEIGLRVVPPPSIDSILAVEESTASVASDTGTVICVNERDRDIVLHGIDFLEICQDGTCLTPEVTLDGSVLAMNSIGGTCEDLSTSSPGTTVRRCTELNVTVPMNATVEAPFNPVIEVTNPNPAGCMDSTTGRETLLTIVPLPTIDEIAPPALCDDGSEATLEISGSDMLVIDGALPNIDITGVGVDAGAISAVTCEEMTVNGRSAQRCTELQVVVDPAAVTDDLAEISLTNPDPAEGTTDAPQTIPVLSPPLVTGVEPPLLCTDGGAQELVVRGEGFLTIDGALPALTFAGLAVETTAISDCVEVVLGPFTAQECTTLTVSAPAGERISGDQPVGVTNPYPLVCGGEYSNVLVAPPTPRIDSAVPGALCSQSTTSQSVVISGDGFLRVDGVGPTLSINGSAHSIDALNNCTDLGVIGQTVENCTEMTISLTPSSYAEGTLGVTLTNPEGGCEGVFADVITISGPPTIDTVDPAEFCSEDGGLVVITGTGFANGTAVELIGAEGTTSLTSTFVSTTELHATIPAELQPGSYDVRVANGECATSETAAIEVYPTPLVFFTDPPVTYSGISTGVIVYTSGLSAENALVSVELIAEDGTIVSLDDFSTPQRPNRIEAIVPAGLAVGTYEVSVTTSIGCRSTLNGEMNVTDELILAVEGIEPAFVSPSVATAVSITATETSLLQEGEVQFVSTPRAYLNSSAGNSVATPLRAMVFTNPEELTAVIPGGMIPDVYDLIVVNPDGAVGLLEDAVTVVGKEPPVVEAVSPSALNARGLTDATIYGFGFDEQPDLTVSVDLDCRDFETQVPLLDNGTVTVTGGNTNEIQVTVDATDIPIGAVCLVTVTNDNGSSFRYSAISFKNASASAATLSEWAVSPIVLNEARRGHGLAAGRPTFRNRLLYAVAGDDGSELNAKTTVESVGVNPFGDLDILEGWQYQYNDLSNAMIDGVVSSAPRTHAGIQRVGRFLYLSGGHDGTNVTNTTLRAQVLDPLATPEIIDLDAQLGNGTDGLGEGIWYYRVSALFPDSDPSNPGGESLTGEVLTAQLPLVDDNIILDLTWTEIPGANGYRLYRSPSANMSIDDLELLAEITEPGVTSFRDLGGATDATLVPLPPGSLGVWHNVQAMNTARMGHALVSVRDFDVPGRFYLYAVGGTDGLTTLASGEYVQIDESPSGSQVVSDWATLGATLATPASFLSGFVVTPRDTIAVVDANNSDMDTLLYFGCGDDGSGSINDFSVAEIEPDGNITAFSSPGSGPNPTRSGSSGFSAGGFLYMFGGAQGEASTTGHSAQIVNPAGDFDGNWDSLGSGTLPAGQGRIYAGSTLESAFLYITGGATTGTDQDVTDSVLLTVQ